MTELAVAESLVWMVAERQLFEGLLDLSKQTPHYCRLQLPLHEENRKKMTDPSTPIIEKSHPESECPTARFHSSADNGNKLVSRAISTVTFPRHESRACQ